MKTDDPDHEIHLAPVLGWYDEWVNKEGKMVAAAFGDTCIGVSTTTLAHVMRLPDGQYEARVGFAVMGSTNMDEDDFQKCGHNPFHPDFHDNFARAQGAMPDLAVAGLGAKLKEVSDSLFVDDFL